MRNKKGPRRVGNFKPDKKYHNMASTYYDWHMSSSQNRMNQKPLSDTCVRVNKYHYKDGTVLTFESAADGRQIAFLLDRQHTIELMAKLAVTHGDQVVANRIAQLEQKIKDLQDAAHQLRGIEGWIDDKDMKQHCTKTLDKLLK